MAVLGLDIGTTHCKALVFREDGTQLAHSSKETPTSHDSDGCVVHPPEQLWQTVVETIRDVNASGFEGEIRAIGVASMAEAGLLLDTETHAPRIDVIPWFDSRSSKQARVIGASDSRHRLFGRSGLHPSFKQGLSKLLWLRDRDPSITHGAIWLSVADYIVFRLTDRYGTDPSLAARTYAYDIANGTWDRDWIGEFGLDADLFPPVLPAGDPIGPLPPDALAVTGLKPGTTVAVGGHDHVCALFGAGVVRPGLVVDSMGTAESFLGVLDHLDLGPGTCDSGLAIVPHSVPGIYCWLGGMRSSGGALDWMRRQLAAPAPSYQDSMRLVEEAGPDPTGVLYFPYLSGSGGVCPDDEVRAAFIGLRSTHGRGDFLKAVLEGTAFEAETIRRAGERISGENIDELVAVGGGTRFSPWVQIKADVSGCRFRVSRVTEAAALGAALAAGRGAGVWTGAEEAAGVARRQVDAGSTVVPDAHRHVLYRRLYETGYTEFGGPLRRLHHDLTAKTPEDMLGEGLDG